MPVGLDLFILAPLAWAAYRGYRRGLLAEIVLLAGIVVGIILSFKLLGASMQMLQANGIAEGKWLPFTAFIAVLGLVVAGAVVAGKALKGVLKAAGLGITDRLAGVAVSVFKTAFMLSSFLFLLVQVQLVTADMRARSLFLDPLLTIAPATLRTGGALLPGLGTLFSEINRAIPSDTTTTDTIRTPNRPLLPFGH